MKERHDISGLGSRFWVLPAGLFYDMLTERHLGAVAQPMRCSASSLVGLASPSSVPYTALQVSPWQRGLSTQGDLEQAHVCLMSNPAQYPVRVARRCEGETSLEHCSGLHPLSRRARRAFWAKRHCVCGVPNNYSSCLRMVKIRATGRGYKGNALGPAPTTTHCRRRIGRASLGTGLSNKSIYTYNLSLVVICSDLVRAQQEGLKEEGTMTEGKVRNLRLFPAV